MLRHLALAALLTLVAMPSAALAIDVGTAAAVNPATRGTPPGSTARTIALGDNIIHNERITTDAGGLVQILFVDGTTLTMGPNSDLVIDTFFYDPNAGTAQVAVTMTKGVLRFIGGLATKTGDGATVTTPVGTIGIRGGIADVVLDPPAGTPQHIDMLFGREVTLQQGLTLVGRLYQGGYSLVMGADGQVGVQKTPPEWSSQMQQALAGNPGTSGGSSSSPDDEDVAESGVPGDNSANGVGGNTPSGGSAPPLTQEEIEDLLLAVALYDELREFIIDEPDSEPPPRTSTGAGAGIIATSHNSGSPILHPSVTTTTDAFTPILTSVTFDAAGNPIAAQIDITSASCGQACRFIYNLSSGTTTATIYNAAGPDPITVAATGSILASHQITLPAGPAYCTCAFLDWGTWSIQTSEFEVPGGTSNFSVEHGTWVVAKELSTNEQLAALASTTATFNGHAIGGVADVNDPGAGVRLAAGDMSLTWSFGTRAGTMAITNFDGFTFTGVIAGTPEQPYFGGQLSGGYEGHALVRGGFANDGSTVAAGVLGDFVAMDGDWQAAGVFMGER